MSGQRNKAPGQNKPRHWNALLRSQGIGAPALHPTNERGQYVNTKPGRNDPCPQGCGEKVKQCACPAFVKQGGA